MGWLVVGLICFLLLGCWAIGKSQEARKLREQQHLRELEHALRTEPISLTELEEIKQAMKANYRKNYPPAWKAGMIVDDDISQNP